MKGFDEDYPGIFAAKGKKLTIQGTGKLEASSNGSGAGIGGGRSISCGDIEIQSGTITATGGEGCAGIGSGYAFGGGYTVSISICGDITITGGTIEATGGNGAAGIGSGYRGNSNGITSCSGITITDGVTSVTATKGDGAPNSIGAGADASCGTVTFGTTVYWDGSAYQNGGDTYLPTSPLVYPAVP